MIKVLFFARVKEALGCSGLELPWQQTLADLDGLQSKLCQDGGPRWREVLEQASMIRAVNQVVIPGNTALNDGDEVAFFPPVTGG